MTTRPRTFALRLNIWTLKFSRRWLRYVAVFFGLYASLPFVAPTLMHFGVEAPARALYTLYSPFCHQFAFRSVFLWGEQPFYPRAVSGTTLRPYEDYVADSPEFATAVAPYLHLYQRGLTRATATPQAPIAPQPAPADEAVFSPFVWSIPLQYGSRDFLGTPQMGYKTALCARDVAIYAMIFVGTLIYSYPPVRRRLRPLPLPLYILIGLGPIALDGLSQLLGYPPFNLWPPRETEPFYRIVTGALFGLMSAWLALPYLALSFQETVDALEDKLARVGVRV